MRGFRKLEELLTNGRVMLRYQAAAGEAWGVNGKLNAEWRSFRAETDAVCRFTDDMVWATEDREGWADAELETLEQLHEQALKFPATSSKQPSALKPRQCRRAVFDFHRGKYNEARMAKAKAKAKTQAVAQAAEKQAAVAKAKAADVKPKAAVAKAPAVAAPKVAVTKAKTAAPVATKISPLPPAAATSKATFEAFLEKVQATLPAIYDEFLLAESVCIARNT